ncbi:MAG: NAD+ synthase [Bacteroidales bacterium]
MKVALAQINPQIGHFEYNKDIIINNIEHAKSQRVDLLIFPELSISGYPPMDLLERRSFTEECQNALDEVMEHTQGIGVLIGTPTFNYHKKGKNLYNSALLLHDGEIKFQQHKTLLPTYDIFDEYRYFEPNTKFHVYEFMGKRLAITICEDLWDFQPFDNEFTKRHMYQVAPMEKLIDQKPDVIINMAASPFSYTRVWGRKNVFIRNAKRYNLPLISVNQAGAQTELIFDGSSLVVNADGTIADELKSFETDFRVYEFRDLEKGLLSKQEGQESEVIHKVHDALVVGIRDYFRKMGFSKATLGLSGGIDSAVALVLAQRALGSENLSVLLLPSQFSSQHSIDDAIALAKNLGVEYETINIQAVVEAFEESLSPLFKDAPRDVTEENLQARARGTLLMALSNKYGHILLNTSNKSESAVGYTTLYGDMNGGLSVLGDVYKTDVYRLARFINREQEIIPNHTINKPPSAELRPDQQDSDTLPPYDILDKILFNYVELQKSEEEIAAEGIELEMIRKVLRLVNNSEYKRYQAPPILRISSKAFGSGRRMPIVAKY